MIRAPPVPRQDKRLSGTSIAVGVIGAIHLFVAGRSFAAQTAGRYILAISEHEGTVY